MITGAMSGSLRYFFNLRTTMSESLDCSLSRRSRTPADLRRDLHGCRLERLTQLLQWLPPKVAESSRRIFLISASVGAFSFGGGGFATKESVEDLRLYRCFFFLTGFFLCPRCLRAGRFCEKSLRLSSSEDRPESDDRSESLEEELLDDDELDEDEELEDDELEEDELLLLLELVLLVHVLLSESLLSYSSSISLRSKTCSRWCCCFFRLMVTPLDLLESFEAFFLAAFLTEILGSFLEFFFACLLLRFLL